MFASRSDIWLGRSLLLALTLGGGLAACRSANSEKPARPAGETSSRQDPYLIEGAEIQATKALNLYEAVRLRRPVWLTRTVGNQSGDRAVAVYLDDRLIGSLNILREMPLHVAQALQYLSPSEAQIRFGPNHGTKAAIIVMYAREP
jgi:hypothetical protein